MIYGVLAMIAVSLVLTVMHYYIFAIAVLALSNVILIMAGLRVKSKKVQTKIKEEGFVITTEALKNHRIESLNESGVLTGKFMISKNYLDMLIKEYDPRKMTKNHAIENIEYLKRKNQLMEINVENNISAYFKYAYEHNETLLYSGEKAAVNLLKIFKVKSINLSILLNRDMHYAPGDRISYIVTGKKDDEINAKALSGADVFVKASNKKEGCTYTGIVHNVLNVKGRTHLIAGDEDEV